MFATHLGSLPGTEIGPAIRLVRDECDQFCLPELPERGPGAQLIGRSAALLETMPVQWGPSGWRLTSKPGQDQRRALARLRHDCDQLEESLADDTEITALRLSIAGPQTLAASLELPRGEAVLADAGAVRDLAASYAESVAGLLAEMGRRFPRQTWSLQVDEPSLPAVLAGSVPTASKYRRYRRVEPAVAAEQLDWFADLTPEVTLHCCAPGLPWEVLNRSQIAGVALDVDQLADHDLDPLAAWLDQGKRVWWGVQPTHVADAAWTGDQLLASYQRRVSQLGFDPATVSGQSALTPACGLAGWSPASVRQVLSRLRWAAERA